MVTKTEKIKESTVKTIQRLKKYKTIVSQGSSSINTAETETERFISTVKHSSMKLNNVQQTPQNNITCTAETEIK